MLIILADNQDITRIGIETLCSRIPDTEIKNVSNKLELTTILKLQPECVVVLDYSLFDIKDVNLLLNIHLRYPKVQWILFSDEFSYVFLRRIVAEGGAFSVVNKKTDSLEIAHALRLAIRKERFLCSFTSEQISSNNISDAISDYTLTKTEIEILREIALGKTSKEIAIARCSSYNTVNTHRRNIFRKLDVSTAYEATKYALRAGIINVAEYSI